MNYGEEVQGGWTLHYIIVEGTGKVFFDGYTPENKEKRFTLRLLELAREAPHKQWTLLAWYNYGALPAPAGQEEKQQQVTYLFAPKFAPWGRNSYWLSSMVSPHLPTEQPPPNVSLTNEEALAIKRMYEQHERHNGRHQLELEWRGPRKSWEEPQNTDPALILMNDDDNRWKFVGDQVPERTQKKTLWKAGGFYISKEVPHFHTCRARQVNLLERRPIPSSPSCELVTVWYSLFEIPHIQVFTAQDTMTVDGYVRSRVLPEFAVRVTNVSSWDSIPCHFLLEPGDRRQWRVSTPVGDHTRNDKTWLETLGPSGAAGPLPLGDPDCDRFIVDEIEFVPPNADGNHVPITFERQQPAGLYWTNDITRLLDVRECFDNRNCARVSSQNESLILERVEGGFQIYAQQPPKRPAWELHETAKRWFTRSELTDAEQHLNPTLQKQTYQGQIFYWTEGEADWLWLRSHDDRIQVQTIDGRDGEVNMGSYFSVVQQAIGQLSGAHVAQ